MNGVKSILKTREEAPFSRVELLRFMDEKKIGTRLLFAGNLTPMIHIIPAKTTLRNVMWHRYGHRLISYWKRLIRDSISFHG